MTIFGRQRLAKRGFLVLIVSGGISVSLFTLSAAQEQKPAAVKAQSRRFGDFEIVSYGGLTIETSNGKSHVDLTGPNLAITSKQYDIAANRITMDADRSGVGRTTRVSRADATGNVRIVIRRPSQVSNITCDEAHYTTAVTAPAIGRIDLIGNVKQVGYDPEHIEGPLVINGESGSVDLYPGDKTIIHLKRFDARGTPREQPAKPTPKSTTKANQ